MKQKLTNNRTLSTIKTGTARWASMIVENRIPPSGIPGFKLFFSCYILCDLLTNRFSFGPEAVFDHLFVVVEAEDIDGPGDALFQSGPCAFQVVFPVIGGIGFDT